MSSKQNYKGNEGKQWKAECLVKISFYLVAGMSNISTALSVGISEKTLIEWMKEHPEIKEKVDKIREGEIKAPFKHLPLFEHFIAYARIKEDPEVYKVLKAAESRFKAHLKKF